MTVEKSWDEVIALLGSERRPGEIIASDGDHTLWRGDIGEALFAQAFEEGWLKPAARPAMMAEAKRHHIEVDGDANAIAKTLFRAQHEGRYPAAEAYAMHAWCFAGFTEPELAERCDTALEGYGFEARVRPGAARLIAAAHQWEVPFYLVTASCSAIAAAAARRLELPLQRVVGMTPAVSDGVLQPRLGLPPSNGEGKPVRLRERDPAPLLAGCGDSEHDAPLMRLARFALAVEPRPALVAALQNPVIVRD